MDKEEKNGNNVKGEKREKVVKERRISNEMKRVAKVRKRRSTNFLGLSLKYPPRTKTLMVKSTDSKKCPSYWESFCHWGTFL